MWCSLAASRERSSRSYSTKTRHAKFVIRRFSNLMTPQLIISSSIGVEVRRFRKTQDLLTDIATAPDRGTIEKNAAVGLSNARIGQLLFELGIEPEAGAPQQGT